MTTQYQLIFSSPPGGAIDSTGAFKDSVSSPAKLKHTTFNLTSDQILNLVGTPVTVIPAPVTAGESIIVMRATLVLTAGTVAYSSGVGSNMIVRYSSANVSVTDAFSAATFTNPTSTIEFVNSVTNSGARSSLINSAIRVQNTGAAFTAGNGTGVLHLWYEVISA